LELTTDQESAFKSAVRKLTDAHGFDGWGVADLCTETGISATEFEARYPDVGCARLHYSLLLAADTLGTLLEGTKIPGRSARTRVLKVFDALGELVGQAPDVARNNVVAAVGSQGAMNVELVTFSDSMRMSLARALAGTEPGDAEWEMARVLQEVWYAALVGWASGVHPIGWCDESVRHTLRILGPFN
jgi:Tetracyclin repressor-like, C-terminal domain